MKPDIEMPRDRALVTAYGLALDVKLRDASVTGGYHDRLAGLRAKLDTMADAEILAL